jgi:hypothetical protein
VVRVPDRESRRSRQIAFRRPIVDGEARFLEELGLNLLMIRGSDPSCNETFVLTWKPESRSGWTVVPRSPHRIGRAWSTGDRPLVTPALDALRLADQIALRESLPGWISKTEATEEVRDLLPAGAIDRFLKSDPPTAALHALILDPPPFVENPLHGVKVRVPSWRPIPDLVQAAWRVAWVDRLAATLGPVRLFGPAGMLPVDRASHLNALAVMLEFDEELMIRMLALAELLIRTLYDGGIGFAATYETGTP